MSTATDRKREWRHRNPDKVREYKRRDYQKRKEAIKRKIYSLIAQRKGTVGKCCQICGESRIVEYCHILPKRNREINQRWNILYLCPTHHHLFDWQGSKLTAEEWEKIRAHVLYADEQYAKYNE